MHTTRISRPDSMRFLIVKTFHPTSLCDKVSLIFNENQTGKLAEGSSKHSFEVGDRTDQVSNIYTLRTS